MVDKMDHSYRIKTDQILPVDIVLAPSWWYKNAGITFDEDFFYHPVRRVEAERQMEKILYERWGKYGLGKNRFDDRPEVGAVHLAAGFLISEMLGCKVEYREDQPPFVVPAEKENLTIDIDSAFSSPAFRRFSKLTEKLYDKYHYLTGDVNWGGILNIAIDLRGQLIFSDMLERPEQVKDSFQDIGKVIYNFVSGIQQKTGTSSISVNRNVIHLEPPVFLHSECSHTMISSEHYETFLFTFDVQWNNLQKAFGIHYCGNDPHRYAKNFAKLPRLDFLDVGWGGNVQIVREMLPHTFINIRLSPVEIIKYSPQDIKSIIHNLVRASGNPMLTGICCINMDHHVSDENITEIFKTVEELRSEYSK